MSCLFVFKLGKLKKYLIISRRENMNNVRPRVYIYLIIVYIVLLKLRTRGQIIMVKVLRVEFPVTTSKSE